MAVDYKAAVEVNIRAPDGHDFCGAPVVLQKSPATGWKPARKFREGMLAALSQGPAAPGYRARGQAGVDLLPEIAMAGSGPATSPAPTTATIETRHHQSRRTARQDGPSLLRHPAFGVGLLDQECEQHHHRSHADSCRRKKRATDNRGRGSEC